MMIVKVREHLGDLYTYHEGYEKYVQPLNNIQSIGSGKCWRYSETSV